jgi:uncharacterized LabA/DUF88 family protein
MADPAVAALASDPNTRVMVFVDGQNLYQGCKKLFGNPHCHPHLLAQYLAGVRNVNPVQCRFYTGRPNPNIAGEKDKTRNLDRRLHGIRASGVTVVTRELRYHWDWGHKQPLPRAAPGLPPETVILRPWQRPQEKGIDLALALDVVEFVLTGKCDVAVVVSLDRDLTEIPTAVHNLKHLCNRPIRLEAAVPTDGKRPKTLTGFHFTHQITAAVFQRIVDTSDYTAPDGQWTPPVIPLLLPPSPGTTT